MFAKTVVTGAGKSPFYVALTSATGATPQWNFHKFLIDRSGKVLANFPSEVEPQSPKLVAAIEQALR
jgi:glutathione peroxidase